MLLIVLLDIKALEKNNIPFDSKLVYTCENVTFQEGIDFAKQILEEHQDVDGIFAITDLVAVGVLSYFNDNKIKVPQQVAVIGFRLVYVASTYSKIEYC
jgi:LacI family transcriptional regulator